MKPFLTLLCLAFLLPLTVFAQNYYPGYLVTNKGDTLKGYVKYERSEHSPKDVQFKREAEGKVTRYGVSNVPFFSIDIGYPLDFQRYAGAISMDDANVESLTTQRDTSFRMDTVFLKILRKDKNVTLYSYDDGLKTRFFVADGQSAPLELVYRIYMKSDVSDGKNTVNENTYKKQLLALAIKYGKMDDALRIDLDNAGYTEAHIGPIVDKINGFTGKSPAKGNNLGSPPKLKLAIMLAAFAAVAYLVISAMNK